MRHPFSLAQDCEQRGVPFVGLIDKRLGTTKEGREFAEKIGKAVYERYGPFDVLIHSDFLRAYAGVQCLLGPYPDDVRSRVKIIQSSWLNERDLGEAFGLNARELEERFPVFVAQRKLLGDSRVIFPGGESMIQMFERINVFGEAQFKDFAGLQVGLVGHFGTHFGLLNWVKPIPHDELECALFDEEQRPKNCSLLVLEADPDFDGTKMKVVEKNLMLC